MTSWPASETPTPSGSIAHEPIILKIAGKPFTQGGTITAALDNFAAKIREANYLRDLPREQFAQRAADHARQ